jgi:hypothetical protein
MRSSKALMMNSPAPEESIAALFSRINAGDQSAKKVSRQTIEKEWRHARAWLRSMLAAADEATNDKADLQ